MTRFHTILTLALAACTGEPPADTDAIDTDAPDTDDATDTDAGDTDAPDTDGKICALPNDTDVLVGRQIALMVTSAELMQNRTLVTEESLQLGYGVPFMGDMAILGGNFPIEPCAEPHLYEPFCDLGAGPGGADFCFQLECVGPAVGHSAAWIADTAPWTYEAEGWSGTFTATGDGRYDWTSEPTGDDAVVMHGEQTMNVVWIRDHYDPTDLSYDAAVELQRVAGIVNYINGTLSFPRLEDGAAWSISFNLEDPMSQDPTAHRIQGEVVRDGEVVAGLVDDSYIADGHSHWTVTIDWPEHCD